MKFHIRYIYDSINTLQNFERLDGHTIDMCSSRILKQHFYHRGNITWSNLVSSKHVPRANVGTRSKFVHVAYPTFVIKHSYENFSNSPLIIIIKGIIIIFEVEQDKIEIVRVCVYVSVSTHATVKV